MAIFRRIKIIGNFALFLFVGLVGSGCEWGFNEQDTMRNATSYQSTGEHNSAIIELKKVLKHNVSNKQARLMIAKSYLDTGQAASAEKELNFARKLGVSMSSMAELWGRVLLLQKKYNKIFQDVPLVLATTPENKAKLMLVHGYAYAALDNKSAAYELFNSVKDSGFLSVEANIALSRHAMSIKDTGLALKLIDAAIASDGANVTAWLHKGQIYLTKQDMAKANNAFEKVIESSNKHRVSMQEFQARVYLTKIALTQKNMMLARKKVNLLVKAVPKHPLSLYLSALVDYQEKKYDSARTSLETLLTLTPNDLRSKLLLGAIYFAKGSYEQANKHLSYFVENVPTHVHARKLLGAVRIKLGQHQDAMDTLLAAGDLSGDSQLLAMIGRAAVLNNDLQKAEKFYKRARASNPENQSLKNELANIYLKRGSVDQAIKELESITGERKSQTKAMLVYAHLRKRDITSAREVVKDILRTEADKPVSYSLAGLVERTAGERLKARKYFNQAVKLDPGYVPGLLSLARMDFEEDILDSAKLRYKKILELDSKNVSAMMGLSALASRNNNTEDAIKWLLQAKETKPNALTPRIVLSRYYLKTGQAIQAVALLSDLVQNNKDNYAVLPLFIDAQLSAGQARQALLTAQQLLKIRPKAPIAYLQMAKVQQALGNAQESEKSLRKALKIKPDYLQANIAMATLMVKRGDYKVAHQIASQIKKKLPKQAAGFMLEGEIYLKQKQFRRAIKTFSMLHKQHPSSGAVRKLSLAYREAGKLSDAVRVLEHWINAKPQDTSVRLDLALNYEGTKQLAHKARAQYAAILEQSPDNVAALNNISLSYIDTDTSKALEYAERAYQLKPDIAAVADTLGWILLKTGDTHRAVALLAGAAEKSQNPSIHFHYAVALHKTNSLDAARMVLDKVLATAAEFPEKRQAKQLVRTISR